MKSITNRLTSFNEIVLIKNDSKQMKKKILVILSLIMMSANMLADDLTATLQQGTKMKAYFGVDAFKKAYKAAKDGAVITLSAGTFNPVESIEKSITIIGTSAFNSSSYNTSINSTKIKADNVKMEGLYFSGDVELGNISNCHIKRCYLDSRLTSTETHTNTFVDQCVVYSDRAIGTGVNYVIKNSTLHAFYEMNTVDNKAQITNCVIWRYFSSSSSDSGIKQPYAIYMNNVLGVYAWNNNNTHSVNEGSEFYYNYFANSCTLNYNYSISFPTGCINQGNSTSYNVYYSESSPATGRDWNGHNGMDGTVVGINGGSGFKGIPSIPRITSSTIDNHTDSKGKINVNISAAVGSN